MTRRFVSHRRSFVQQPVRPFVRRVFVSRGVLGDDAGFMAAEWVMAVCVVLIPTMVLMLSFTRYAEVKSHAQIAAAEAARAAVQSNSLDEAQEVAEKVVQDSLVELLKITPEEANEIVPKAKVVVSTEGGSLEAGELLTVEVTANMSLVLIPGSAGKPVGVQSYTVKHSERVDDFRLLPETPDGDGGVGE